MARQSKSRQEMLRSEARFRALIEGAAIGIALVDLTTGRPVIVNLALQRILGYTETELTGMPFSQFTHPDDNPQEIPLYEELLNGKRQSYQLVKRYLPKSGPPIWCRLTASLVKDGDPPQYGIGMVEDLTERRQLEEQVQADTIRIEIQKRLLEQREQERLAIARDLHDGPVQALSGMAFTVQGLLQLTQDPELLKGLEQVRNSLQDQIAELREYAAALRPPAMTRFGLIEGIQDHLEVFEKQHPNFTIQFLHEEHDAEPIPANQRLVLFRIYQEAMQNIAKHAYASEVQVRLDQDAQQAALEIHDNGDGFAVPAEWLDYVREGHFGLAGMQERADVVGGTLTITSIPGKGTTLRVSVPLSTEPAPVILA